MSESEMLTRTLLGNYADGQPFRLTMSNIQMPDDPVAFTLSSLSQDCYSVLCELSEATSTEPAPVPTVSMESKAEDLVAAIDGLKEIDPSRCKVYLERFLSIMETNKMELLKFEHISNLVYGYVLCSDLQLYSQAEALEKLQQVNIVFQSTDHIRFENGRHIAGPHGRAPRTILIMPNFETNNGYLLGIWDPKMNVTLSHKPMIVKSKNAEALELEGVDPISSSYAATLKLQNDEITEIDLHIRDQGILIRYQR